MVKVEGLLVDILQTIPKQSIASFSGRHTEKSYDMYLKQADESERFAVSGETSLPAHKDERISAFTNVLESGGGFYLHDG